MEKSDTLARLRTVFQSLSNYTEGDIVTCMKLFAWECTNATPRWTVLNLLKADPIVKSLPAALFPCLLVQMDNCGLLKTDINSAVDVAVLQFIEYLDRRFAERSGGCDNGFFADNEFRQKSAEVLRVLEAPIEQSVQPSQSIGGGAVFSSAEHVFVGTPSGMSVALGISGGAEACGLGCSDATPYSVSEADYAIGSTLLGGGGDGASTASSAVSAGSAGSAGSTGSTASTLTGGASGASEAYYGGGGGGTFSFDDGGYNITASMLDGRSGQIAGGANASGVGLDSGFFLSGGAETVGQHSTLSMSALLPSTGALQELRALSGGHAVSSGPATSMREVSWW